MEKLNELNNKIKDYKKGQSGKFYKDELAEMEEDEATFWELYAVKELEYIKDEESDDDMSITTAEKMTLEETDRIIQLGLLECYITPPNSPIVSWKNDYDLWEKDRVENEKMVGSIIDDVIDLATRKKTREEELNEARWKRTKRTLELNFQRRQRETTEKIVGSIIDDVIDLATRKKTQTIEEQRKEAQEKRRLDYERRQKEAEEKEAEEKRQSDIEASLQEALRIQEEEAQEAQAQEEAQIAEHQTQLEAITQLEAEVARLAEINERNIQTRERRHRPNCECETCRRELEQAIQEGRARTALRDERNRQARDAEIARQEAQAQEEAQIAEHQARLEQEAEIARLQAQRERLEQEAQEEASPQATTQEQEDYAEAQRLQEEQDLIFHEESRHNHLTSMIQQKEQEIVWERECCRNKERIMKALEEQPTQQTRDMYGKFVELRDEYYEKKRTIERVPKHKIPVKVLS
jgi:IgA-specific serine endopeptidase